MQCLSQIIFTFFLYIEEQRFLSILWFSTNSWKGIITIVRLILVQWVYLQWTIFLMVCIQASMTGIYWQLGFYDMILYLFFYLIKHW